MSIDRTAPGVAGRRWARRAAIALVLLLLARLGWRAADLPPPGLLLRHGAAPAGGPTIHERPLPGARGRLDVMLSAAVLLFDAETDARIRGAWAALADAGISRSMLQPGIRPHLTLSVGIAFDFERLRGELGEIGGETAAIPVGLSSLGMFPETGAVFLGVTPTAVLFDIHRRVDAVCGAASESMHEWYRPDAWVPHVSLATGLPADGPAAAVVCLAWLDLKMAARAESFLLVEGDERGWTEHGTVPLGGDGNHRLSRS